MGENINNSTLTFEKFHGVREIEIAQRGKEKIKLFRQIENVIKLPIRKKRRLSIVGIIKKAPSVRNKIIKMIISREKYANYQKAAFTKANSSPFNPDNYYDNCFKLANPRASGDDRNLESLRAATVDWLSDDLLFEKVSQKFNFESLSSNLRLALKPLINKELNTFATAISGSEGIKSDITLIDESAQAEGLEFLIKAQETGLMSNISQEMCDQFSEYFDEEKIKELIDCGKKAIVNESYGELSFGFIDKQGKRQAKTFDDAEIDDLIAQKPGSKSEYSEDDIDKWM